MNSVKLTNILLLVVVIFMVFERLPSQSNITDLSGHRLNHSGMRMVIDQGTGCEYLTAYNGGITPRVGMDGKQICAPYKKLEQWHMESDKGIMYELYILFFGWLR